jgi:hypothetical protein
MRKRRLTGWLLVLAFWMASSSVAWAGPEIFALTPESGPAGCTIAIKGKRLNTTQQVLFAVGRTVKTASFRIVSDAELQVIAPEVYRPGAAATVAVLSPNGLTVAMPAAVEVVQTRTRPAGIRGRLEPGSSFYHVLRGGWVQVAEGVALIENGGVVAGSVDPAMHLVKRGGALMDFNNPNALVFYEPGAFFGRALLSPAQPPPNFYDGVAGPMFAAHGRPQPDAYISVPQIVASPGVGPFVYERPAAVPATAPAGPPSIGSIVPAAAWAGDVITLSGRGLARTTEVLFMDPFGLVGLQRKAGFRIISDQVLKVEIPEPEVMYDQVLVVSTTEGLTVTVPRQWTIRPAMGRPSPRRWPSGQAAMNWVAAGDLVQPRLWLDSPLTYVEPGGTVTATPGTYFIKQGATMVARGAPIVVGPQHVYFEPGANIPESFKRAPVGQEARAIVASFVDQPFTILAGPHVRW